MDLAGRRLFREAADANLTRLLSLCLSYVFRSFGERFHEVVLELRNRGILFEPFYNALQDQYAAQKGFELIDEMGLLGIYGVSYGLMDGFTDIQIQKDLASALGIPVYVDIGFNQKINHLGWLWIEGGYLKGTKANEDIVFYLPTLRKINKMPESLSDQFSLSNDAAVKEIGVMLLGIDPDFSKIFYLTSYGEVFSECLMGLKYKGKVIIKARKSRGWFDLLHPLSVKGLKDLVRQLSPYEMRDEEGNIIHGLWEFKDVDEQAGVGKLPYFTYLPPTGFVHGRLGFMAQEEGVFYFNKALYQPTAEGWRKLEELTGLSQEKLKELLEHYLWIQLDSDMKMAFLLELEDSYFDGVSKHPQAFGLYLEAKVIPVLRKLKEQEDKQSLQELIVQTMKSTLKFFSAKP